MAESTIGLMTGQLGYIRHGAFMVLSISATAMAAIISSTAKRFLFTKVHVDALKQAIIRLLS